MLSLRFTRRMLTNMWLALAIVFLAVPAFAQTGRVQGKVLDSAGKTVPDAKIVVGRWGPTGDVEQDQELLREAGADQVEASLLETRDHLNSWLPVLASPEAETTTGSATAPERLVAV